MEAIKTLVVGGGSIGQRHLKNLKTLGVGPLAIVEPDAARRKLMEEAGAEVGFASLEEGLAWQPEIAVIATPSHLHVTQGLAATQAGCHLFLEKPLAHEPSGLNTLREEIERRNRISLVGCNMRFHPGPAKVKQLLGEKAIGRVLFARVHVGAYLPDWRPWQDYRKSYSANASMGGGCILDGIHEIDLTCWYLGDVNTVFCVAQKLSTLEIDVEDVALLLCQHQTGTLSEIHLDYVQRTYERGCQIVGERGSIFWDYTAGTVRWFDADTQDWQTFSQPEDWQPNQMYLDEMQHFIDCIRGGRPTTLPVSEAIAVMEVAFAAKASAQAGAQIELAN